MMTEADRLRREMAKLRERLHALPVRTPESDRLTLLLASKMERLGELRAASEPEPAAPDVDGALSRARKRGGWRKPGATSRTGWQRSRRALRRRHASSTTCSRLALAPDGPGRARRGVVKTAVYANKSMPSSLSGE